MRKRVTVEEVCIVMQVDAQDPSKIADTILNTARNHGVENVLTDLAHALSHLLDNLHLYIHIDFEGIAICYVPSEIDQAYNRELLNKVRHIVDTFRKLGFKRVEVRTRLSRT